MQINSQQGGFMTCSPRSVEGDEGSADRWKDTAFSAKYALIVSAQISHPHLLHLSLPAVTAHSATAALIHPLVMHPSIHYLFTPSNPLDWVRRLLKGRPHSHAPRSILFHQHLCMFFLYALQYLCVGLVVLAVVGGGIGAVWGCGRSCRAVGEGARALGDNGSDGGAVHPGARLSSLGFTPHWSWAAEEGTMMEQTQWVRSYIADTTL